MRHQAKNASAFQQNPSWLKGVYLVTSVELRQTWFYKQPHRQSRLLRHLLLHPYTHVQTRRLKRQHRLDDSQSGGRRMDQTAAESSEGTLWSRILASTDRNSARGSGASDRAGSSKRIVALGRGYWCYHKLLQLLIPLVLLVACRQSRLWQIDRDQGACTVRQQR